ncbi:MAG: quinolinate synthase NadA [Dehalococcoidia bacterium]|nr:quinolinate synthase NadA [Dehalococcoidia bacterium]
MENTSIVQRISQLKQQRNAIILAHNYQPIEIQNIADFVGDSLELAQQATLSQAEVLVFCGVYFMAETAYILSPRKTVLIPDSSAGCPMADMITAEALRAQKQALPGIPVVCYVNSTAAVKAQSDICCTSANAARVVESLSQQEILFVPDQYLGQWISTQTHKKMHYWPGYCPVHAAILPQHIAEKKSQYPQAKVIVHPECRSEVSMMADAVPSTSGMLRFAKETTAHEIIVGTETGLIQRMQKENPSKEFIPANSLAVCQNMKLTTLEKLQRCLEEMQPVVTVPEDIRVQAFQALERMLQVN